VGRRLTAHGEVFTGEDTLTGLFFDVSIYAVSLLVIFYGLGHIALSSDIFAVAPIPYTSIKVHALSISMIFVSFLMYYTVLDRLYPPTKFFISALFTLDHTYLGGIMWAVQSQFFRGTGFNSMYFIIVVSLTITLYILNLEFGFVKDRIGEQEWTSVLLSLSVVIIGYVGLQQTSFWEAMTLSDLGLGGDPNRNIFWLLTRIPCFVIFLPIIKHDSIRAPLRMQWESFE